MLDLTNTTVAETPVEKMPYTMRLSSISCLKSKDNNNLRLEMRAVIVDGPCTGFELRCPPVMLYDSTPQNRTAAWIARAKQTLGKILGNPDFVEDLPDHAGEVTPTMKALLNAYFVGTAKHIPEQENKETGQIYEAKWEVGRYIGPAEAEEVVEVDWSTYFGHE